MGLISSRVVLYEYLFHLTLPNGLPYSRGVVMLFGHRTFLSPLVYNSALLPLVCESPSSSGYIIQPLDFELVALASLLSMYDNHNSRRRVTFHVHWLRNCCTRIPLMVTADTSPLGHSCRNFLSNLPALGLFFPSDRPFVGGTLSTFFF